MLATHSLRGVAAFLSAPILAALAMTAQGRTPAPASIESDVRIQRNAQGVPHITAANEQGLGYGYGYAYAQDNLCLLANEILTVSGERSRYLGADAGLPNGMSNLESDVFFGWLNSPQAITEFLNAQDAASRALLAGYAAGYNRYLSDTPVSARPAACGAQPWLRPITEADIARLMRRLTVEAGAGHFARAIVAARPPQSARGTTPAQHKPQAAAPGQSDAAAQAGHPPAPHAYAQLADWDALADTRGSNAIALGRDAVVPGTQGILLGNPHFPWSGGLRFYQVRLTIPGQLDVAGASLAGMPAVNIGFNRYLAWTHTVDTSRHFVVYRVPRDPARADHYLVDGVSEPLVKRKISVPVASPGGGAPALREHTVYETRYGPVMVWPGVADWSADALYAIADPNLQNHRALRQWYAINRAGSVTALREAVTGLLGIPWVNTVATDDTGSALYLNVSVTPGVDAAQITSCRVAPASPLPVLDGGRSACALQTHAGTPQAGILPAAAMPVLERSDYVQNSNDSAWMTQPARPLTGYSPLISQEGVVLGNRARYALQWLGQGKRYSADDVRRMVLSDEVGAARWVMDDLLTWCAQSAAASPASAKRATQPQPQPQGQAQACQALAKWDRSASLSSGVGLFYFEAFAQQLAKTPALWAQPFDPARPLDTPRGLKIGDAVASAQIGAALDQAVQAVAAAGIAPDATLRDVQGVQRGDAWIAIPGGAGRLGVYNAIESVPDGKGRRNVVSGTSYLQVVSFDRAADGAASAPSDTPSSARSSATSSTPSDTPSDTPSRLRAWTLLAYSQSTDPASPYFRNQTEQFARGEWVPFDFDEADAQGQVVRLRVPQGGVATAAGRVSREASTQTSYGGAKRDGGKPDGAR